MDQVWNAFQTIPSITRTWLIASLIVNIGTTIDIFHPHDLIFNIRYIVNPSKLELWRILTSFLLLGNGQMNNFHVLIGLYLIVLHSSSYEKNPYNTGGNPRSDYVFCLCFCIVTTIVSYLLVEWLYQQYHDKYQQQRHYLLYPLFSNTIIASLLYLWSKRNPHTNVNLNFIPIQGQYLPFAHVLLAKLLGNSIVDLVHGIFVGHVYYYLIVIVPTILGKNIIRTPAILTEMLNDIYGEQEDYRRDDDDNVVRRMQQRGGVIRNVNRNNNNNNNDMMRRRFQQEGATDAHIAAKMGDIGVIRRLSQTRQGRQSLCANDRNDWQPLHEAVRGGYIDIVNLLLSLNENEQGTEDNNNGDDDDDDDDTPPTTTMIRIDINARTQQGNGPTPLWIAETTHGTNHPVTQRLRELGAIKIGPR